MNLVPAYGRDYKSKKALEEDFNAGKDFQIRDISNRWDGSYVNKEDLVKDGVGLVTIRYSKLSKVTTLKVNK